MGKTTTNPLRNSVSDYAAIDIKDKSTIIAEGKKVDEVIRKADKTGKEYLIMYIPKRGQTYIY